MRGAFAAPALGRDYSSVEVLEVGVCRGKEKNMFELKTRARFDGCGIDLSISGGSLLRSLRDFEWLRSCLKDEYAGCVVPPITSEVYSEGAPEALERFMSQCLAHGELQKAPELACFCVSDHSELDAAKTAFAAARARVGNG